MNTQTPQQEQQLTWSAPRIPNHTRSKTWYATGGFFVIAFAVYGVLSGAWSLSLVCVLCGALYFLIRDHAFPDVSCTLNEKGVHIAEEFLAWSQVKGYWFVTTPTYTELHIVPKKTRTPDIVMQLGAMQPLEIRTFLAGKTEELIEKQERILDILLRLTKL